MATLEKIRNKAALLVIAIGLALFAFIIGDFLNSGSAFFRQTQELVASVNGNELKIQDYQFRVDEMAELIKSQNGSSSIPDEYMTQIRKSVFDSFVQEVVLNEETEKLGLVVSPEELFDMVQGENVSPIILQQFTNPETGTFDKTFLLNFLKQINANDATYSNEQKAEIAKQKAFWLFLEKNVKRERLESKYVTLLSKAISANNLDAKDNFDSNLLSSDVVYAMQSYSTIPDSLVSVSESELNKLYNQRKELYKQKESQSISYIAADIRPSEEDYAKANEEIEAVRTELASVKENVVKNTADIVNESSEVPFIDAFFSKTMLDPEMARFVETASVNDIYGPTFENDKYRLFKLVDKIVAPDSVEVAHIMIAGKTEAETKHLTDSLVDVINKGGNFQELARTYSVDQAAQNGGVLGWFTESTALRGVNEEFKNALFSNTNGKVAVVKSMYGTHIVKVLNKTRDVAKYKIADVEVTVSPSSKTYSKIYNDLNQFIQENSFGSDSFEAAAKEAGYSFNQMVTVSADDPVVGSIRNSRQVVRWAFQHSKSDQSEIMECGDKFVVAKHNGTYPKGYRSLKSVTPSLKSAMMAEKKGDMIATQLLDKKLTSLDAYATEMGSKIDSVRFVTFGTSRLAGVGLEPNLNAAISLAKENQLSGPIKGNNGVYVFSVVSRNKSDKEYNEAEIKKTMDASNMYRFGYQSIQSLINRAEIEDYRVNFY